MAHSLIATLRDLSNRFAPFGCDLTGGRDSRVLAAALIAGDIPATFNTGGSAESADVQIATKIAEAFHLPHHINNRQELVTDRWDEGVRRLIRQNDGMVNLWQVANSISMPQNVDNIPLWLWGIGGEIARGFYYSGQNLSPTLGDSKIVRTFCSRLVRKNTELLKEETRQLALQSVGESCQTFLNDGFEPLKVPQAFYAFDRVRRWAGTNFRKAAPICDMFTPFCTILFIETAFAMPLHDQITGRLHNELINAMEPSLLDFPYNKPLSAMVPKRSIRRVVADTVREAAPRWLFRFLRYSASQLQQNKSQGGKGPVQAEWVEAKREAILDVCLGQHSSVLWNYVDRRSFEKIMSSQTPAEIRRPYCARILSIATLFHYEAEH